MKFKNKFLALSILALSALTLPACNSDMGPDSPEPVDPPHVISEKAMASFLGKIQSQGYTMVGVDEALTTSVYDANMVTWFYKEGIPYNYDDHFAATIDGETFYGFIDYDLKSLAQIKFVDRASAIDLYSNYLPTAFLSSSVSGGNIWGVFHNDPNQPLLFHGSQKASLYAAICRFCGIMDPDTDPARMSKLQMEFDNVDVHQATIKFKYNQTQTEVVDKTITITFDEAVRQSQYVVDWVNDPNREYPQAIGDIGHWPNLWNVYIKSVYKENLGNINNVDLLPYDTIFSYATKINESTVKTDNFIRIQDFHGTKVEANHYMYTLLQKGYTLEMGDSAMVLRSQVVRERDGFTMCSNISIQVSDEDGLVIIGQRFYSSLTIDGRNNINNHLNDASDKFVPLPDDECITGWVLVDHQLAGYENYLCHYDCNIYAYVYLIYEDSDSMNTYLTNYFNTALANGFVYNSDDTYTYSNVKSRTTFKVYDNSYGVATLAFYNFNYTDPAEANTLIVANGLPDLDMSKVGDKFESVLDLRAYNKAKTGHDYLVYYWATFKFETYQDVADYEAYYGGLLKDLGFQKENDANYSWHYINADKTKTVLVDIDFKHQQSTSLSFFIIVNS